MRGLFERQAGEYPALDDAEGALVDVREALEGQIDRQHLFDLCVREEGQVLPGVEWEGTVPYDELPAKVDPESGYLITANNRIVGDDYPHHITSEYLDGFRAKRIEQLLGESEEHDLEGFEAMQSDNLSLPGIEAARRLGRLHPRGQREISAVERLQAPLLRIR